MMRPRVINVQRTETGFGFNVIDVDLPAAQGIFVSHVAENGPADDEDGLREGMQVGAVRPFSGQ